MPKLNEQIRTAEIRRGGGKEQCRPLKHGLVARIRKFRSCIV